MSKLKNITFSFIMFFICLLNLSGQQEKFQHLNGLIFEGKLLYFDSNIIRIEKNNGEVVEFPMDAVRILPPDNGYLSLYNRKWTGFLGIRLGFGGDGESDLSAIGFETGALLRMYGNAESRLIHDLVLKTGLEKYNASDDALLMPFSIGYRLSGSRKKVVPFAFVSAGGAFNITKNESIFGGKEDFTGGFRLETGAGINIKFRDSALEIYLSYLQQKTGYSYVSPAWGAFTQDNKFNRIFLTIAIHF
jgi:hypothetical protein